MEGTKNPLYKAINTGTTTVLTTNDIIHSAWPVAVNKHNRNTMLTITASVTSEYSGEVDIYYNRLPISQLGTVESVVGINATDYEVKLGTIMEYTMIQGRYIDPNDLSDTMAKTQLAPKKWKYELKAAPTSYCYIGTTNINAYFQYTDLQAQNEKRVEIDKISCLYAIKSTY